MIGGKLAAGYTIFETLVVLAITGMLFLLAMTLINGQQAKAEFAQSVRDFHAGVEDVINDVSHGFFPAATNFTCSSTSGSQPTFNNTDTSQGQNKDCIFIGKVMAFKSGQSQYSLFSVAGARHNNSDKEVANFSEAKPVAVDPDPSVPGHADDANLTETRNIPYGLEVTRIYSRKGGSAMSSIGAVGIFSTFGSYDAATSVLDSGATSVVVVPLRVSRLNNIRASDVTSLRIHGDTDANPDNTVICLRHGGPGTPKAAVIIGSKGRQTSTDLHIGDMDTAVDLADDGLTNGSLVCP